MKFFLLVLLLGGSAISARAQHAVTLADYALGRMQVDARLLDSLAGVDARMLGQRVEQAIQRQGLRLVEAGTKGAWDRGYVEVSVEGERLARKDCRYRVTVTLRRYQPDAQGVGQLTTVDTKAVSGSVSAASLSLTVLVAVEEQAERLLMPAPAAD